MPYNNYDRFAFSLQKVTFIISLLLSAALADGIVLRNGMQIVVTIRDTSGDSISIQEGMWQAEIAKSLIASFWYNGKQYSYIKKNSAMSYSSSTVSQPAKKIQQPDVTIPQNNSSSTINHTPQNTTAIASEEDLLPLPDTAMLDDLDLTVNDSVPDKSAELEPLFDPEYTIDELVKKKRVFRTLLIAGCAMGATSTAAFIASNDWDIKAMAVPFMIASIPLSTVGIKKSIEYQRRFKSAEYKKQRAQLSLSFQIQKADLLLTF